MESSPPFRRNDRRPTRGARDRAAPPTQRPPADALTPWVQMRSFTLHPFIYKRMLGDVHPMARPGDDVAIYDTRGEFFGRGLYNPRSQIAVRVMTRQRPPLDDAYWRERLTTAVQLRGAARLHEETDAYRLVHAEGDGLSGLIVERYADHLVFEVFALGIHQRLPGIAATLTSLLGAPASLERPDRNAGQWRLVARADTRVESVEGFKLKPLADDAGRESVIIREHGIRYRVETVAGHKTGFFCDQRDNRKRFARLCKDANVLDLCCYTGGFGLCAKVLGGAKEVISVDLDEAALQVARDNINLNQARIELVHADAFQYVRQMIANGRRFDALVLDPPKLAPTREDVDDALRKYYDFNGLCMQVLRSGGFMLSCSCSGLVSRDMLMEAIHRAARALDRTVQILDQTGAGIDHPVMANCPESEYLKAVFMRVF